MAKIGITGELESKTTEGKLVDASQVKDGARGNKSQAQINTELEEQIAKSVLPNISNTTSSNSVIINISSGSGSKSTTIPAATTETAGVMGAVDKKALDGKDTVQEQSVVFDGDYQWHELETPIKAGSIIKISGAGVELNFYTERSLSAPNYNIVNSGVAEVDFTYVRNIKTLGEFHIKSTIKSKIGELASKIELVDSQVKTIEDALELQPLKDVTLYPAGDNLFFHDTKENYKELDVNTYISGEHYIAVEGGKDIIASGNNYGVNAWMYDSDYKYINTKQVKANTTVTLPDNCSYIKWGVAVYDLINKSKIMVNYGTEVLPYSPFLTSLALELSGNIEEVSNLLSVVNAKVDGKDAITEQVLDFTSAWQWQKLSTPIKAGSIIEVLGAGTGLNFYEKQFGTATLINGSGEANADYTYVRNLDITGEFNIKVTEKSKIGVLEDKVEAVENKVDTLSKPKANLILTEPVVLSSTSEHCLYLDDAIEGNAVGHKYGLTGTQFASYGSVAYVNKPAIGSKKGTFYALSAVDNANDAITVKSVAPNPKAINMLDIGSSYIDIGTVTQRQYDNYVRDGYTVNILGTMGAAGKKHEARSGGTWDFLVKPLGRAVILDVSGVTDLPTTGYPGTTYQDANGVKWSVRGVIINGGVGKLVLSSFSVDTNYGDEGSGTSTDYDIAAANLPLIGTLTKTTNDSTGTSTDAGDDAIQYTGKELVYYNPFWNPTTNELDFVYYINKWGFATPDIITLTFGSNDLGNFSEASQADVDAVVAKAVSVVNRIHEQLPNCKVLITCSCYGYKGVGNNDFRVVYRIKNIQKYYKTLIDRMGQSTSYGDYVRIVPTMCMIDRENGFWISEKVIHSSFPAVKCADDIVHPNTAGFNQFADAMLGYAYELLGE